MQTVTDIIAALGGSTAISRDLGIPLTTIEGWKAANYVPEWRQPTLLDRAKTSKVKLRSRDFPPVSERIARKPRITAKPSTSSVAAA
jgi:hypothetical protein